MYILAMRAYRKNAKRHISGRFKDIDSAIKEGERLASYEKYQYTLHTGNWFYVGCFLKIDGVWKFVYDPE